MKITIDNNQRIFLINRKGFFTNYYFCNLVDIPNIINSILSEHDEYTISEYWNFKFKKCSKKHLNEMFENNNINFKLK